MCSLAANSNTLTISGAFSTQAVASGQNVAVVLTDFLTPYSTAPAYGFSVYTATQVGGPYIDQALNISVSVDLPAPFASASV